MLIPNASVIRRLYESHDYLNHPVMAKALDAAMVNPTAAIEVPNDFLSKKAESSSFFSALLSKISTSFQGALITLKCTFNKDYAAKFDRAVSQIETAYSQKVSDISNLAHIIMCNKEPIESTKEMIYKLQGRIKELEETIKEDKRSLEEMINIKNLVVDDAKALLKLEKKAQEDPGFFWNVVNWFLPQKPDPGKTLIQEIKDMDDSFPTREITEEFIRTYEREQVDNSQLISNIQLKKKHIIHIQELLASEKELLVQAQALLQNAAGHITKATQYIKRLNLEDYFSEEDLEIPDIAVNAEAPAAPKELTPQEIMMQQLSKDISDKTGVKELSTLFKVLLGRFPEDAVKSWKCDDKGNFTLQLKERYQLWIPGGSLPGGAILLFGNPDNGEIKGKLEKNKFSFDSGINSFVKVFPLGFISPTLDTILFHDKTDIALSGSYLGQSDTKHKTFSQLKKDWESNSVVVPPDYAGGYQQFLKDKIAQG